MIENEPQQPNATGPPATASWLSDRMGWAVMAVVAALWTAMYSVVGIAQYLRYHIHAFDLGIFAQGTWLLSQLKEPFVTVRGLHLFADHSSYILILIAPVYAVFPSAVTLIVVTIVSLTVSGVVVFAIARNAGATVGLSVLTGALLLVSPAVGWQIRDVFHPEVMVIPLVLAAVWLLQRDRDIWAIVAVVVALTAKEDVGLLVVPFGLGVVWILKKRKTGFIVAGLGLFAFVLNFFVLLPAWSPTGELLYSYRYDHLGDSPLGIFVGLLTSPDVWFETITDPARLWYVAGLLLAMPLAVLAWRWLLVGVPALAANVLSNHGYQYEIEWHYTAYLIVVVAIAGAYGAARVRSVDRMWLRVSLLIATVVAPAVLWVAAAPIEVWAEPHPHHARIDAMLEIIPADGSVSAWTTFVPHLANREEIYLVPNPFENYYYGYPGIVVPDDVRPDYLAIRADSYREFDSLFDGLIESGEYTVFYDDPPFRLLRRVP